MLKILKVLSWIEDALLLSETPPALLFIQFIKESASLRFRSNDWWSIGTPDKLGVVSEKVLCESAGEINGNDNFESNTEDEFFRKANSTLFDGCVVLLLLGLRLNSGGFCSQDGMYLGRFPLSGGSFSLGSRNGLKSSGIGMVSNVGS